MNATTRTPPDAAALESVAEAAAGWMVRLQGDGSAGAAARSAFDAWLAADPVHARVWGEMAGLDAAWARLREAERQRPGQARAARSALAQRGPARRRVLYGLAALVATGTASAVLLDRRTPLDGLLADLHTGTGERSLRSLPDGSTLRLDARSTADLYMDTGTRRLRLRRGALALEAAPDPRGPWQVQLEGVQALTAGRVVAEVRRGRLSIGALAGPLRLETTRGNALTLREGESAVLDGGRLIRREAEAAALIAWTDGLLDLRSGTLGDVIEALRDYTPAWLHASPAAAELPVFGVFWLDDLQRTMRALQAALPLRVQEIGGWAWRIDVR